MKSVRRPVDRRAGSAETNHGAINPEPRARLVCSCPRAVCTGNANAVAQRRLIRDAHQNRTLNRCARTIRND